MKKFSFPSFLREEVERAGGHQPSLHGGSENLRFRDFRFKIRFETFWIVSDQKIRPNLFKVVIFSLFWPFWPKTTDSTEKIHNEKIFSISRFSFYNTFWNILNRVRPKKFYSKNFWLCHFSLFWPKNDRVPGKDFLHGQNFRFWDFWHKIRFETFWIDFDQKFFDSAIFTPLLAQKITCLAIFEFFRPKWKTSFANLLRNFITLILSHQPGLYLQRCASELI